MLHCITVALFITGIDSLQPQSATIEQKKIQYRKTLVQDCSV